MKKLNKADLVAFVAADCGTSKRRAGFAVDAVVTFIQHQLRDGNNFTLSGLGTFKPSRRKARSGEVLGRKYSVPERMTVTFRPSPNLKTQANK